MKRLRRVLFVCLALLGFLLAWSVAEPYVIGQETTVATVPNLPESLEGQRVALVADFQVGMWLGNTWTVQRIVDRLVTEKPAAVLIAGDFIYHPKEDSSEEITRAAELVKPLVDAGIPTYAVLGNHDYRMPTAKDPKDAALAEQLSAALEAAGVRVLQNEAVSLPSQANAAEPLYIVGLGSHVAGEDDPEAALAQLPGGVPRLLLMHHPDSFALLPAGSAPAAFAGHTHGGQLRLPFTPEWSWMTYSEEDAVHADGWVENYGEAGNNLYINRGIGFSVVPLRLNCTPELTLITLSSGAA